MARRVNNLTPDSGEFKLPPFNFATAKNSVAFRTPMAGGVDRLTMRAADEYRKAAQWGNLDSQGRIINQASFGTPWKILAMMAARLVRGGMMDPKMGAAFNVARNMPRGPVAARLGASMVRASVKEAEHLLEFKPSTMFTRGFSASPAQAGQYYRALAKIMGRTSNQFPMELRPLIRATGHVLKNESRKYMK